MTEIDEQFKPKRDFFVAWILIAIALLCYARPWTFALPWFSKAAFILVVPFILTFFIYGPILFLKQVVRSGARGWFVFRTFISVMLFTSLSIWGLVFMFGFNASQARLVAMPFLIAAIVYLNCQMERSDTHDEAKKGAGKE
jgi:hypothetical protein